MTRFNEPYLWEGNVVEINKELYLKLDDKEFTPATGAREGVKVVYGIHEILDGKRVLFDTNTGKSTPMEEKV